MSDVSFFWYQNIKRLLRVLLHTFLKIRVRGVENFPKSGAVVLVSNHQSVLDPVLCGMSIARPITFMARDTLFLNRTFGAILRLINVMPLKRDTADFKAMKTIIERLKDGQAACLFPESTRTFDGKIADFKPGFGLLCRRGNAAVIPMVIEGAYECWPREKKFCKLFSPIHIHYGKVIPAEQAAKMNEKQLAQELTSKVRELQAACRREMGKEPLDYSLEISSSL